MKTKRRFHERLSQSAPQLIALASLLLACAWAAPAFGQSDRGNITGTVTDQSGAVVPRAKITVTSLDTNEVRETESNETGNFTVPELKAGPYKMTVEAQGFKTTSLDKVQVAVQVTRTADVALEAGSLSDVINVTSEQTQVIQTDTPVRQTNVTERQVKELPLLVSAESGGRTPLAFIFLDSSVSSASGTGTNASNFRINGGQGLGTEILIDGAATRRAQNGTFFSEVAPGPNAFQEFTISTSTYSAEFGNSTNGVVNFTIKSGGNAFHGEAYELFRNEALNANSFFNNANRLARPRDRQHDFGGNLGGPVFLPRFGEGGKPYWNGRNRTFFFFNYEGYRFSQSENALISVPTARMRTGDFSELLTDPDVLRQFPGGVRIFDPTMPPGQRNAIPGNRLDLYRNPQGQSVIDPVGSNILQFFPLPTRPGVFRNYQTSTAIPTNMDNYVAKIDQTLTGSQSLAFSYSYRNLDSIKGRDGVVAPRFPAPFVASNVWNQFFKSHYARLQHNYTISSTLLNHFNAGWTRYEVANKNFTEGFDPVTLGFRPESTQRRAFPIAGFPGYGDPVTSTDTRSYQGIGSTFFSDNLGDNAVQFSDFLTWVKGKHTVKFGADVRTQQFNVHQLIHPGGEFNFRHPQTSNNGADNEGWPIASLITGATEFSFNSVQTIDPGWRQFSHSYFVNDDWKVTQKLTLNLGLRYDLPGLRTEARDRFRGFDPRATNPVVGRPGAIISANATGALQAANDSLAEADRTNFGPRVGFAYALGDKTVVRGGAGVYYAPILYGFGGNNTLTEGTIGYNTDSGPGINGGADANPNLFLRSYRPIPAIDPFGQFIGSDVDFFDPGFRTGRTVQYSLDVQRELPFNFMASVGYVGNRGTRLRSDFGRLNALPLDALKLGAPLLNKPLANVTAAERAYASSVGVTLPANNAAVYSTFTGNVAQALRPFPQYRVVRNQLESQGQSWYNALQVKLDRRFSSGIQFGVSYTWSKLITDAAEDLFGGNPLGAALQNPYDRRQLRSVSQNNPPHVVVINYLLELPFGQGRRFLNQGGFVDRVFGGWQLSGIHRYQHGLPLVVGFSNNVQFLTPEEGVGFLGRLRPNLTGQPVFTDASQGGTSFRLVNPAAFAAPPNYQAPPTTDVTSAAYRNYYADPLRFFGNAPPVLAGTSFLPFYSEDFSILKKTRLTEAVTIEFRAEFLNALNRHRYFLGGDERDFRSGAFGTANVDQGFRPRAIQLGLRLLF